MGSHIRLQNKTERNGGEGENNGDGVHKKKRKKILLSTQGLYSLVVRGF